jgi:hypothetical protein
VGNRRKAAARSFAEIAQRDRYKGCGSSRLRWRRLGLDRAGQTDASKGQSARCGSRRTAAHHQSGTFCIECTASPMRSVLSARVAWAAQILSCFAMTCASYCSTVSATQSASAVSLGEWPDSTRSISVVPSGAIRTNAPSRPVNNRRENPRISAPFAVIAPTLASARKCSAACAIRSASS